MKNEIFFRVLYFIGIISYLAQENPYQITFEFLPEEILSALYSNSNSKDEYINRIMEAIECDLLDLRDRPTLKKVIMRIYIIVSQNYLKY